MSNTTNRNIVYRTGIKQTISQDIINKLKKSEEEIERGEGIEAEIAFRELRQKYGY